MQYPGTVDNWIDQSGITAQQPQEVYPRPLLLTAAAFDRGPEKITRVYGQTFYKLFGYYIDFEKYGQAAIQAANIINNIGGLDCSLSILFKVYIIAIQLIEVGTIYSCDLLRTAIKCSCCQH